MGTSRIEAFSDGFIATIIMITKVKMANLLQRKFSVAWAAAGAAGICFAAFGWMVYTSPLRYSEMDFNHAGRVGLFEADYASSYGKRAVQLDGKKCLEFFSLKDGLTLKIDCSDKGSRTIAETTNG